MEGMLIHIPKPGTKACYKKLSDINEFVLDIDEQLGMLSKKKRYYLGIFPNMGGGSSQIPKLFL